MKPKPILFSTNMVQALLDGRKTQTRRVIKPQYAEKSDGTKIPLDEFAKEFDLKYFAPYQSGDILWVRETWAECATIESFLTQTDLYAYKADYSITDVPWKWKPSIHMPFTAARIFLRVTDVRAERLQDITDADAKKEGMLRGEEDYDCELAKVFPTASIAAFSRLWDSLNAKRGFAWDSNPFVWVYEFERCEKPQG